MSHDALDSLLQVGTGNASDARERCLDVELTRLEDALRVDVWLATEAHDLVARRARSSTSRAPTHHTSG